MWMQYPGIEELYSLDDQYFIGSDLLVKPITEAGVTETEVNFPSADSWYDVDTTQRISSVDNGAKFETVMVKSDIDKIPVYQRGGSVLARKLRLRRSTQMMSKDPYTLYIALNKSNNAAGEVYMDDEHSFSHEGSEGKFGMSEISVEWGKFIKNRVNGNSEWASSNAPTRMVERIVVMGVVDGPSALLLNSEHVEFQYSPQSQCLVMRSPKVSLLEAWEIEISS
jgi:alpha 1,3-glucosidase